MTNTTKEEVVRSFLKFLSQHVPLGRAQLATLGGRGLEAKIWSEQGIPAEHGWLIERSRARGGKLINQHRYMTHNQLGTFDRILAGHSNHAFIDGFHLDLCGNFCNAAVSDFASVMPLVLESKGRCLAITVADARRNLVLEQWPNFWGRARRLLGQWETQDIYDRLEMFQRQVPVRKDQPAFIKPFDPVKASRREFGLLVEFMELLRKQNVPWLPTAIERYIYVSHYANRPFRMRTYFFHFGEQRYASSLELAFAQAWVSSKLFFANGDGFHEVEVPSLGAAVQPTTPTKGVIAMAEVVVGSRLGRLAEALGGAEEAEYDQLMADRNRLYSLLATFKSAMGNDLGAAHEPPVPKAAPAGGAGSPGRSSKKAKKQGEWKDLSPQDQVEWQLKAIELKAGYPDGRFPRVVWQKLLEDEFGAYSEDLAKSLRSALAHTSGRFRDSFVKRIKAVFGDQAKPYLDRLAKI